MEVDEALSRLGKFGKWQMLKYCMVCTSVTFSGCWHMMAIVFIGGEPQHHCALDEGQSINESIPLVKESGQWRYSKCLKYVNRTISNDTMKCNKGWYYEPEYKETIITEWDLVCDKNYLMETSQSVFSFGVMVGAIVFTSIADRIGRKVVHLGCQYCMLIIGLIIAFAPNYISFVVLRFLQGAFREGAGLVGIVMACELFPAAQRTFAGTALELFWASAYMILALMAYLITHWRHLQLTITFIPILTVALIWLLPESIPWLVANGREEEAEKILQEAAKFNGIPMPSRILRVQSILNGRLQAEMPTPNLNSEDDELSETTQMLHKPKEEPTKDYAMATSCSKEELEEGRCRKLCPLCIPGVKDEALQYSCLDIARSKIMLLNTFIMCSLWFASGLIYFGLSLSTSQLVGDKYVNFFLSGFVEAPAYGLTVFVLQKYGRRWPLFVFHLIAGIVLLAVVWIPEKTDSGFSLVPVIVTLTMLGKFAMTAAFGTVVLYAPEIYPTNLRNLGFGLASVWGRIGGMIAPFSSYIAKQVPWIPSITFSIVAFLTGVLTLMLPETLNRPLPETIEEIETWTRTRGKLKHHSEDAKGTKKNLIVRDKNGITSRDETAL